MTALAAAPRATTAAVVDSPGEPTTLTLYGSAGAVAAIVLGPAECVALAADLLASARVRMGRPPVPAASTPPPPPGTVPPGRRDLPTVLA